MSHHDDLPTLDLATLAHVTGGASSDMTSMMLPLLISKRKQSAAPAPAPAPTTPPWTPKVTVDGVQQSLASSGNNTFSLGGDAATSGLSSFSGGGGTSGGGGASGSFGDGSNF